MKIGIIGTGALGIALANCLNSYPIVMWTKFEEECKELLLTRENKKVFKGVKLRDAVQVTTDMTELKDTDIVIVAIPFVAVRDIMGKSDLWYNSQVVLSMVKGVEDMTFKTTSQIMSEYIDKDNVCVLSGPSFAIDIANESPIRIMFATQNDSIKQFVRSVFKDTCIHLHEAQDCVSIELCGAIKNAVAIGAGMLEGLNASDSTKAAYLATGEYELARVLEKFGVDAKAAYSYAGIGDLILTCMSETSRNYTFGKLLGEGKTVQEAFEIIGAKTVEGYKIIKALHHYINEGGCNSKLLNNLYEIVFNGKNVSSIIM